MYRVVTKGILRYGPKLFSDEIREDRRQQELDNFPVSRAPYPVGVNFPRFNKFFDSEEVIFNFGIVKISENLRVRADLSELWRKEIEKIPSATIKNFITKSLLTFRTKARFKIELGSSRIVRSIQARLSESLTINKSKFTLQIRAKYRPPDNRTLITAQFRYEF